MATDIKIYATADNTAIRFVDNGCGMDRTSFEKMLSLGYCEKNDEKVGKYGNGFKSGKPRLSTGCSLAHFLGSMRIGKDAVVFTKNRTSQSVGFLSQTFLQVGCGFNFIVHLFRLLMLLKFSFLCALGIWYLQSTWL